MGEPDDVGRGFHQRQCVLVHPPDDRHELAPLLGRALRVNLEDTVAGVARFDVDLGVEQVRQEGQAQRAHESFERLVDAGRRAGTVGDDGSAYVAVSNAANEQELLDEVRRRADIDLRWRDGNQDGVRASKHLLHEQPRGSRRRVDDELPGLARHEPAEAPEAGALSRRGVSTVDMRRLGRALLDPAQARALRVVIHDGRRHAVGGEITGEVGRDGSLADAALGIHYDGRIH